MLSFNLFLLLILKWRVLYVLYIVIDADVNLKIFLNIYKHFWTDKWSIQGIVQHGSKIF